MKAIILFLLVVARLNFSAEAAMNPSADTATDLSPAVDQLKKRTIAFAGVGYTDAADGMARQTTRQLLAPSRDKIATAAEADVMVDAHLRTELYYAFNTKWGTGKERDHRIVYDFLSQLNKSARWTPLQKDHFTILTVLSLAAQEYFWNEKSTIDDLQDRVRRELRYGDFKKAGHVLDISNAVHLDAEYLERIIRGWVNTNLNAKLKALMDGFKGKELGRTYTEIVVDLDTKFGGRKESLPFDDFGVADFSVYGLGEQMSLLPVISDGDNMCGFYGVFSSTDGANRETSEGNARYKMLRAILDNPTDHVARRFYLHNSEHMDGGKFEELIERFIKDLQKQDNAAQQVSDLQAKLDAYQKVKKELEEDKEKKREIQKRKLLSKVISLYELRGILGDFKEIVTRLENIEKLANNKEFTNIIDAIILVGTNTETGGCVAIKERLEKIKAQLDSYNQQIVAKKNQLEGACKEAKSKAGGEWLGVRNEIKALETRHKELSGSEAVRETEINELLGEIKIKKAEEVAKYEIYQHIEAPYTSELNAFKANILNKKYILIINTLKDLIGPDMLLSNSEAFSVNNLCIDDYPTFVIRICQAICAFVAANGVVSANTTGECIDGLWEGFNYQKVLIDRQMDKQLINERFEMVESLSILPAEFAPSALAKTMEAFAKKSQGLKGWLRCDSVYTQLWAILNNLNVFVFSGVEPAGRPPFELIGVYDRTIKGYADGLTGKHLATVMLTSPTAKNVFLDKSTTHYDKFIAPGDYAAMARAQRHLEWRKLSYTDKYAQYP